MDTKYPFPELKSDNGSVEDKMMVRLVMMEVIIMIMTKMTQFTLMMINLNSDMMVQFHHVSIGSHLPTALVVGAYHTTYT